MFEVASYITELPSASERAQIDRYFERQRTLGFRLKEPVSKTLRGPIHEIRPGAHRFLFFYHKGQMIIVHSFRKKSRHTPEKEIGAAVRKRQAYLNEGAAQ